MCNHIAHIPYATNKAFNNIYRSDTKWLWNWNIVASKHHSWILWGTQIRFNFSIHFFSIAISSFVFVSFRLLSFRCHVITRMWLFTFDLHEFDILDGFPFIVFLNSFRIFVLPHICIAIRKYAIFISVCSKRLGGEGIIGTIVVKERRRRKKNTPNGKCIFFWFLYYGMKFTSLAIYVLYIEAYPVISNIHNITILDMQQIYRGIYHNLFSTIFAKHFSAIGIKMRYEAYKKRAKRKKCKGGIIH